MGIVRNPANTMRRGRVGETTYYISGGQQIARQALNGSNFGESARRSEAQQKRRVMWANLVNFYKASRGWMPKAFESKKRNQSDYNKFMQLNINSARIALTKSEAAAGAVVVDGFIISQGSLPSIAIQSQSSGWSTSIALGDLTIDDSTSVAAFTQAVINSNASIKAGQQLSFVSYQQTRDALSTPRCTCRLYEVTLDLNNSTPLRAYLPEFCSQVVFKTLGTAEDISVGAFAYILSEQTSTGLMVSTQQLVSTNRTMVSEYSSASKVSEAVLSYGVDKEVILSPLTVNAQSPEAQPVYISSALINGVNYLSGQYVGTASSINGKSFDIEIANRTQLDISEVQFGFTNGREYSVISVTSTPGHVKGVVATGDITDERLVYINLVCTDDSIYTIVFDGSETGGDL